MFHSTSYIKICGYEIIKFSNAIPENNINMLEVYFI